MNYVLSGKRTITKNDVQYEQVVMSMAINASAIESDVVPDMKEHLEDDLAICDTSTETATISWNQLQRINNLNTDNNLGKRDVTLTIKCIGTEAKPTDYTVATFKDVLSSSALKTAVQNYLTSASGGGTAVTLTNYVIVCMTINEKKGA